MADRLYGSCSTPAQTSGALALTEMGCSQVSGKIIPIGPNGASVEEGFEITNFNFRASSSQPPLYAPGYAPGPVKGFESTVQPTNKNLV